MVNKPMIVVAAAVVVAASSVAYYLHSRSAHRSRQPQPRRAPAAVARGTGDPTSRASGGRCGVPEARFRPWPTAIPAIRDALGEVAGSDAVTQYLVPDSIIRHIVVTIDNLPRQKVPVDKRPIVAVAGTFRGGRR